MRLLLSSTNIPNKHKLQFVTLLSPSPPANIFSVPQLQLMALWSFTKEEHVHSLSSSKSLVRLIRYNLDILICLRENGS